MADSSANIGGALKGKYGTYLIKNKIGNGGNGDVFSIEILDKSSELTNSDGYVLKVLRYMKNSAKRTEREERFRREIDVVSNRLKDIKGIIPILDSSFANADIDYPYQWYLMPRAKSFEYSNYTVEEKLKLMFQVAETISKLHKMGLSHRDIKPDNLLIYKNRLCLTDFGLIWSDDFDLQITRNNESIGPWAIKPPELEAPVNQDGKMFFKSDVYLFAKTLWIVLTGVKKGFRGRYSRSKDTVYLKSKLQINHTLEPIHKLLEDTTHDEYENRISVDECLTLLNKQILILNDELDKNELHSYKYQEALLRAQEKTIPNEVIVNNSDQIYIILKEMARNSELIISEFGRDYNIGVLKSVRYIGDYVYCLSVAKIEAKWETYKKNLYFRLNDIHITDKKTFWGNTEKLGDIANLQLSICSKLNYFSDIDEKDIGIDGRFVMKLVP